MRPKTGAYRGFPQNSSPLGVGYSVSLNADSGTLPPWHHV